MIGIPVVGHLRQWWREVGPGFNKSVLNPAMLPLAGRRHWYTARLEHVGRRSGRPYATPVVARRVPGGFAIPLPYGTEVDWLRNVQVAGTAALVVDGSPHPVCDPHVVRFADVAPDLPWGARATYRRLAGGPWLRLSEADTKADTEAEADTEAADNLTARPDRTP